METEHGASAACVARNPAHDFTIISFVAIDFPQNSRRDCRDFLGPIQAEVVAVVLEHHPKNLSLLSSYEPPSTDLLKPFYKAYT